MCCFEVLWWPGAASCNMIRTVLCRLLLPQSHTHHPPYQNKVKMSALHTLGLDAAFENPAILGEGVTIHEWMLNRIKCDNLTSSIVTNGLVHDLSRHVHAKASRHHQHDPTRSISKAEMTHILCFLTSRMSMEEITASIVRGVTKRIPKEEPPDALWTGIDFIKKQASVAGEGDGADERLDGGKGGESCVGGEGSGVRGDLGVGEEEHAAGVGDRDARLEGGGEEAGQGGETGGPTHGTS